MEFEVIAVYDNKALTYKYPLVMQDRATAIRWFTDRVNSKDNELGNFPNDFALMVLGRMDNISGVILSEKNPINLGMATQYLREVKNG